MVQFFLISFNCDFDYPRYHHLGFRRYCFLLHQRNSKGFIQIKKIVLKLIIFLFKRDHVRVKPMMVLLGVMTVLSFFQVLSFSLQGILSGCAYGLFYGYLFVVVYSLYDVLREEYERGFTVQYHAPGAKI